MRGPCCVEVFGAARERCGCGYTIDGGVDGVDDFRREVIEHFGGEVCVLEEEAENVNSWPRSVSQLSYRVVGHADTA
jgi:hypothetical protein